jgi:hypothetical protein
LPYGSRLFIAFSIGSIIHVSLSLFHHSGNVSADNMRFYMPKPRAPAIAGIATFGVYLEAFE